MSSPECCGVVFVAVTLHLEYVAGLSADALDNPVALNMLAFVQGSHWFLKVLEYDCWFWKICIDWKCIELFTMIL